MDYDLAPPWLLIASPQLVDPHFEKTVVLIVEHGENGTLGFVINRPCDVAVADLITNAAVEVPKSIKAWYGGPVEASSGIILQRHIGPKNMEQQTGHFLLSASDQALAHLVNQANKRLSNFDGGVIDRKTTTLYPYRFLVGYAGWAAQQLDEELRQGAWLQAPLSEDLLFETHHDELWERALSKAGIHSAAMVVSSYQEFLN